MTKKSLVVFDIDGVLLNSDHRVQLWLDGKVEEYFSKALGDTLILQGITICKTFLANFNYDVLFVTGRGDTLNHREDTLLMLRCCISTGISNSQLLMREYPEVGPHLHDTVKKPLMIEKAGYDLNDIFMVFEDRKSIVDMWRARGVMCYQTQDGNF